LGLYLKFIALDGKPEKGERKIADDCVLMIYEVWEQEHNAAMFKTEDTEGVTSHQPLFLAGLLEYAY